MAPHFKIGDEIQVDLTDDVKSGDIVVAVVDGLTVLRKIHIDENGYIFIPMNSKYDCIFSDNPVIIGRVVGFYRKIGNEPFIKETGSNIAGLVPCFDARPALELANNCGQ